MSSVIDADTHIAESRRMWDLFEPKLYPRRPVLLYGPEDTLYGKKNVFWLIDGNIFPKPAGKGGFSLITPSESAFQSGRTDIEIGCRELSNVPARLADMDRLNVDVQVVYPTLFLVYLTDDPELELALCRAYNRWLAEAWAQSNNRVRWVVVPPLKSIDETVRELRFGKENGAVGVFFRGIERDRTLDDPYFFPIYEEASRLDLPICVHTGAGCPSWTNIFDVDRNSSFPHIRMLPLIAFRDIVANKIPARFPGLRFGFIEAGAFWVPYVLHALKRLFRTDAAEWGPGLFAENRIYVACEADEDITYLARYIGEDHLVIGSDYGHNDPSEERELVATLRAREDVPEPLVDKILRDNPRRLYGL
jgi:predicted TIM-barrel fold metal-dependent hydrolase